MSVTTHSRAYYAKKNFLNPINGDNRPVTTEKNNQDSAYLSTIP